MTDDGEVPKDRDEEFEAKSEVVGDDEGEEWVDNPADTAGGNDGDGNKDSDEESEAEGEAGGNEAGQREIGGGILAYI